MITEINEYNETIITITITAFCKSLSLTIKLNETND